VKLLANDEPQAAAFGDELLIRQCKRWKLADVAYQIGARDETPEGRLIKGYRRVRQVSSISSPAEVRPRCDGENMCVTGAELTLSGFARRPDV
jgi:hypothetical protein